MVKRIKRSPKDVFHLERLKKFRNVSNKEQPEDYKNWVVLKPWGYEYLIFENKEVAVWFLHINNMHSTSMHCHPKKKTSLILLSGNALCNTFERRTYLEGPEAIVFEQSVFHSTKALSSGGIKIIEVETPPDKTDLVRLNDEYGRQMEGYEGLMEMRTDNLKDFGYFFFDTPRIGETCSYPAASYQLTLKSYDNSCTSFFEVINDSLYCLLKGTLSDGKGRIILEVGDVILGKTLNHMQDVRVLDEILLLQINR